ncbi:MAG: hypothetical protein MUF06_06830 [Pirellulaceae bacterium]|jgi:hypothetical protein|nr:hypothetical protein [Pirellulaceae bacterium]
MTPRERMLALLVGSVGLILAVFLGWSWIDGKFRVRRGQIATLEGDISKFKQQVLTGKLATKKLSEYEARSLPPAPDVARSLYQAWLLERLAQAGFVDPEVKPQSQKAEKKLYVSQLFILSGRGTLPQLVDLLHSFYSVDYLHRINTLSIKPIKDSKELDITLQIDAMSLLTAPPVTELHNRPSDRLARPSKDEYLDKIVGRNLFGPANQAPRLSIGGSRDVVVNRSADIRLSASDPDKLDTVRYRLLDADAPEAQLDPATGRFSWTPRELGRYRFAFEAYDDGFPSTPSRREEVVINVIDPPPVGPPVATGFTGFDDAKYTDLTGVTEVGGVREVWLRVRPRDLILHLRAGDAFEIGSVSGVVHSIGPSDFTFERDGKLHKLEKGRFLDQTVVTANSEQAG